MEYYSLEQQLRVEQRLEFLAGDPVYNDEDWELLNFLEQWEQQYPCQLEQEDGKPVTNLEELRTATKLGGRKEVRAVFEPLTTSEEIVMIKANRDLDYLLKSQKRKWRPRRAAASPAAAKPLTTEPVIAEPITTGPVIAEPMTVQVSVEPAAAPPTIRPETEQYVQTVRAQEQRGRYGSWPERFRNWLKRLRGWWTIGLTRRPG